MTGPKWAVIVFPGSNCDQDCVHALRDVLGYDVTAVWHKDRVPVDTQCIIIPGGFSYGDYMRAGSLAAMSPVMKTVRERSEAGALIIGICNGFQVLCETGLLPGALMRNDSLRFRCHDVYLRVEDGDTPFTAGQLSPGDVIRLPIAHGYGNYYIPPDGAANAERHVLMRYSDASGTVDATTNPNGSWHNAAGVTNDAGNVLGMMPHPERAVETLLGGTDGLTIFRAMDAWARERLGATA